MDNSPVTAWHGIVAATGWHLDEPTLPILVVLGIGVVVVGALWGVALSILFRRSR
jgi:hypothetical protein